jgi:ABC-type lipoprotein release transport system permease subunit
VIAVIAGAIGVFGGFIFFHWLNTLAFQIPNELLASLLGGPVLTLQFLPNIACASFILAAALGFFASIYPMETTVRIEPMAALRQG